MRAVWCPQEAAWRRRGLSAAWWLENTKLWVTTLSVGNSPPLRAQLSSARAGMTALNKEEIKSQIVRAVYLVKECLIYITTLTFSLLAIFRWGILCRFYNSLMNESCKGLRQTGLLSRSLMKSVVYSDVAMSKLKKFIAARRHSASWCRCWSSPPSPPSSTSSCPQTAPPSQVPSTSFFRGAILHLRITQRHPYPLFPPQCHILRFMYYQEYIST